MNRAEICAHVGKLISDDRNKTHGDPHVQFEVAQTIKGALGNLSHLTLVEVESIDMICTKLSRLAKGAAALDHWIDIIGYAAIAAEARETEESTRKLSMNLKPQAASTK